MFFSKQLPDWTFRHCPAVDEDMDWELITAAYDWVKSLRDVPQNPIYHAEGDVYIHTRLVLEKLMRLQAWQNLPKTLRSILFLSALMHDIGKSICTKVEDGRIISPHHGVKGARMARTIMYSSMGDDLPFPIREYVFQLVCHHGFPLWALEKPDAEKRMHSISQQIRLHHLGILAEADARGRICPDLDDLLYRIALFRELANNDNCYHSPFPFANNLSRFTYFRSTNGSPTYVPFDDTQFEVILMVGLPGSGKNTWVAENAANLPVVSLDDIRRSLKITPRDNQGKVLQAAKQKAKELLRRHQPFVWNATNLLRQRRKALVDLFCTYKARIRIVYLEVPYAELLKRNRSRNHPVPTAVLHRFIERMEVPEVWEAHQVDYWS